jgi:hypothetical protein
MPYFKDNQNKVHNIDAGFEYLLPDDCIEITDEEAEQIRLASIPQPTLADLAEAVRVKLQEAIDNKAKEFGFMSGGNALMLYAGFVNPFQPLAQVFATWEASVWVEADAYKADVIAGLKPMLTGAEAVALMPVYPS